MRFLLLTAITLVVVISLTPAAAAAGREEESVWIRDIRPLFERYCLDCHSDDSATGGVSLSPFLDGKWLDSPDAAAPSESLPSPEVWYDVLHQVHAFTMPPADSLQPSLDERRQLRSWLEQVARRLDDEAPRTPGRVPPRRLTRAEYQNSIRDLIGIDFPVTDDFPRDDSAHGFDNVADALTLSPLLMEKYLAAAEKILDRAIVTEGSVVVLDHEVAGRELRGSRGEPLRLESEVGFSLEVPSAGDFEVRMTSGRTGNGDAPATAVLKIDGVDHAVWTITADGDHPEDTSVLLPLAPGTRRISLRHTWHTAQVARGDELPDIRLAVESLRVTGPLRAVAHHRIFGGASETTSADRNEARAILEQFATRAYRRPATENEVERLLRLFDSGQEEGKEFAEAVRLPLLAVLVSPHFLFRIEKGEGIPDADGVLRLSHEELATRLSYFLWSSPPDEELRQLAADKKLHDEATLASQVARMLKDPRSQAFVQNFGGQWLGLRNLDTVRPDRELFPRYGEALRQAMEAEVLMQLEEVMRGEGSLLDLLAADYTFVNEDLARHYRLPNVSGSHMRRITLDDPVRGGVISSAAVLTLTSHPTRTNPVKRGKWLLEEILGAPPPPPPPDVPELDEPAGDGRAAVTLRERLERHRSDPQCFGCHVRMDALGLGLENFDAVGRWRDREEGQPIRAEGELPGGEMFSGPADLKQVLLAHQDEFARCITEKVFTYALGRALERSDRREVRRVAESLPREQWQFSTLVREVVLSYPFQYRLATEP